MIENEVLHDVFGNARLVEGLCHAFADLKRLARVLQNDGVPGNQCRGDRVDRGHVRVVPRRDNQHRPPRHALDHAAEPVAVFHDQRRECICGDVSHVGHPFVESVILARRNERAGPSGGRVRPPCGRPTARRSRSHGAPISATRSSSGRAAQPGCALARALRRRERSTPGHDLASEIHRSVDRRNQFDRLGHRSHLSNPCHSYRPGSDRPHSFLPAPPAATRAELSAPTRRWDAPPPSPLKYYWFPAISVFPHSNFRLTVAVPVNQIDRSIRRLARTAPGLPKRKGRRQSQMQNVEWHLIAGLVKALDWFDNSLQNVLASQGFTPVHRTQSLITGLHRQRRSLARRHRPGDGPHPPERPPDDQAAHRVRPGGTAATPGRPPPHTVRVDRIFRRHTHRGPRSPQRAVGADGPANTGNGRRPPRVPTIADRGLGAGRCGRG